MKIRTPITLVVLVAVVIGGGWYGWQQLQRPFANPFEETEDETAACTDQTLAAGDQLRTDQVLVNVYNAGTVSDLAEDTLEGLAERGFVRGVTGNAPQRLKVDRVMLVGVEPGDALVRLVSEQFKVEVQVRAKPRLSDAGIDIVVGNGFKSLRKAARAPTEVQLRNDLEVCVPPTIAPEDAAT